MARLSRNPKRLIRRCWCNATSRHACELPFYILTFSPFCPEFWGDFTRYRCRWKSTIRKNSRNACPRRSTRCTTGAKMNCGTRAITDEPRKTPRKWLGIVIITVGMCPPFVTILPCDFWQLESALTDEEKPKYLDKFRNFVNHESFFGYMVGLVSSKEPLAVLCHGDCWTNNFLFQYAEDGSISEVLVVNRR